MLPPTPCCCRHFYSAFLKTARQPYNRGSLATRRKSPKIAINRLFHTIYLRYHSVGTSVLFPLIFVNLSKSWAQANRQATVAFGNVTGDTLTMPENWRNQSVKCDFCRAWDEFECSVERIVVISPTQCRNDNIKGLWKKHTALALPIGSYDLNAWRVNVSTGS